MRLYIPSHRGLFIGQALKVGVSGGVGNTYETFIIIDLGLDEIKGPYIVADGLMHDHAQGEYVYNKNVVNGLTIQDTSNYDNQSPSLIVNRTTYGSGDTFAIQASLRYQGDIVTAGGDEGGVGVAAEIRHDINCFWGEVESWDHQKRELVYKPLVGYPQKLGTSRPLIAYSGAR